MKGGSVRLLVLAVVGLLLAGCAGRTVSTPEADLQADAPHGTYKLGSPYRINGIWYFPEYDPGYEAVGTASWYGKDFHGRPTANGEVFDMARISAAHPTLPLPSRVEVTNLENGRSIELRVNDRGPFHDGRLIDLSQAAARALGFEGQGLAKVRVRFVSLLPAAGVAPRPGATSRPAVAQSRPAVVAAAATPRRAVQTSTHAAACGADAHFVQVAAFGEPANAVRLKERLTGIGRVDIETANPLTRVRLGPYPSRGDAVVKLAELQSLGYRDALVVRCS